MNLIVVESPTKARTLSRFLGKGYGVEATMGHIKDLPKSKLGVDVEHDFVPEYLILKNKNKYINKIRKQAKKTDTIYIATDPDREGEAIAQHVREILNGKATKRIVFHEITKNAVESAIKNPQDINKNLVNAQIARRVLDRLVGYKLSPLLWRKVRRGLSAGRVQSVAVRLIVEREREIEAFVPREYWEIFCEVTRQGKRVKGQESKSFIVRLVKIGERKAEIKNKKDSSRVVAGLEKADYKVLDVKKREVKKSPYPPFTTSTMTQTSARFFGWSTRRTMTVAQRLYELGLITYHRTDSTQIAKVAIAKVREFIKKEYRDEYLPDAQRFYKTKSKVAQEAHEAIRPTKVSKLKVEDTKIKEAGKLYDLIWKRFVACQMADSIYDETRIDVEALRQDFDGESFDPELKTEGLSRTAQGKQSRYQLRASGQVMKFDGWKKVFGSEKGGNEKQQLPDVRKEEPLDLIKVDPQQKFTMPPARYGEASLVRTLEKLGIGRPSTYAPIITTIQARNYVEKVERKFRPTPVGITVNDFLIKYFPKVFDFKFTAEMEDDLDNIANGERKWVDMMSDFYKPFDQKLEKVIEQAKRVKIETEKLGKKCPTCEREGRTGKKQGELVIRVGRFGKFVSCSSFPDCKHTEKYVEKIGMKCPKCGKGDVIVKQTKKRRKFYGCSRYPKCDWASWRKPKDSKSVSSEKNS